MMQNDDQLTLHIRLTKKCNADCSYCSSYSNDLEQNQAMSLLNFEKSIEFIKSIIFKYSLGGKRDFISFQLIGGEISLLSIDYLENVKKILLNHFSFFKETQIGIQSNLIASKKTIHQLSETFEHIGTSFDHFTNQRTIKGDSEKYKKIFLKNISEVKKQTAKNIGGVTVVDSKMLPHLHQEIEIAHQNKRSIVLRPVFKAGMGCSAQDNMDLNEMTRVYCEAFEHWFLKQSIIVEPFFSSLMKRLAFHNASNFPEIKNLLNNIVVSCPSQKNCAQVSLNLDPNGDIFLCQDMSDSQELKLGNALDGVFHDHIWQLLKARETKLHKDCFTCPYFQECQGGCMKESFEHHQNLYEKTHFCATWKKIYERIDEKVLQTPKNDLMNWIKKIK